MRWLFMLLLLLNVFYCVWHQQVAPPRVKEVAPLSSYRSDKQDIHLLSESPQQEPLQSASQADAQDGDKTCLFVGGYEQLDYAKAVEQRLTSLDIGSQEQSVDTVAGTDYWVYLAPLPSSQASMLQLKELQARKIDSFIIDQGDLANGISLGVYPRNDSAQSVVERLREAGYDPAIKELPRAQRYYWIRIAPQSRRLADDGLLEKLVHDFPGLRQKIMPCESIATPG